jgi:preprotein translocase subunit SecD
MSKYKSKKPNSVKNKTVVQKVKSLFVKIGMILAWPFIKIWSGIKFLAKKIISPTSKGRNWQIVVMVVLLTFFALNLDDNQYWNTSADYLNKKIEKIPNKTLNQIKLPHFYKLDFRYGLDIKGGVELIYKANFDKSVTKTQDQKESLAGMRDVLEKRVNSFGVSEPEVRSIQIGANKGILISLPGITDKAKAKAMIGETPYVDFREQRSDEELKAAQAILSQNKTDLKTIDIYSLYFKKTQLNGKYIKNAALQYDQYTNKPQVVLNFSKEGQKIFADLTGRNVGKTIGIFLDNRLISNPRVEEKINSSSASITGIGSVQEAQTLKQRLNSGALPVAIELLSEKSIDATLGTRSLNDGIKAGIYGGITVICFMLLLYRIPGFFASIFLLIYTAILLMFFKLFAVTLTLSGIAGIVFSIGIAVDANVLIFERMKEEIRKKRDFITTVDESFKRAWPSIRDSNVSTLITCAVLFWAGAKIMQGFALTLGLGILVSMFSAFFVTRIFLRIIAPRIKSDFIKKYLM